MDTPVTFFARNEDRTTTKYKIVINSSKKNPGGIVPNRKMGNRMREIAYAQEISYTS